MRAMSTREQWFERNYYRWTGNKARRKQRLENAKAKRQTRRKAKTLLRRGESE